MLKNIKFIKQKENISLIEQYFEIISKKVKVNGILLFGSVARGNAMPLKSVSEYSSISLKLECVIAA